MGGGACEQGWDGRTLGCEGQAGQVEADKGETFGTPPGHCGSLSSARSGSKQPALPAQAPGSWLTTVSPGLATWAGAHCPPPARPPAKVSGSSYSHTFGARELPANRCPGLSLVSPALERAWGRRARRRRPGFRRAVPAPCGPGHMARGRTAWGEDGQWASQPPSRLQGEACLERDPRPVQNLKPAPRSDPAPLRPARPAPGQCSQVCEIVQGLIRSEHVQQPDHLGRRPERRWHRGHSGGRGAWTHPQGRHCAPGRKAPCRCPHLPPLSPGPGSSPGQHDAALAHLPADACYFWMVTA